MERAQKETQVGAIRGRFDRMTSAVFVDFQGMTVDQVTRLRDEFRKGGVEYRVVKNTLVRKALGGRPWLDALGGALAGMTGVAWSYDDPSAAAKVVKAFRREPGSKLRIKAGVVEGQVLDATAVEEQLATMPGKNELRAMLLATLQAPLQNLVALLQAPGQNLVYALAAKKDAETPVG